MIDEQMSPTMINNSSFLTDHSGSKVSEPPPSIASREDISANVDVDLRGCISSAELSPNDVLCGRGNFNNPGNLTLVHLCNARHDEYMRCTTVSSKADMATELLDELHEHGVTRFLLLVAGKHSKASREKKEISYWREMDQKAIDIKIKQTLRQKRGSERLKRLASDTSSHKQESEDNNVLIPPEGSTRSTSKKHSGSVFPYIASSTAVYSAMGLEWLQARVPALQQEGGAQREHSSPIGSEEHLIEGSDNVEGFVTHQDLLIEKATRTLQDNVKIESDLRGITNCFSSLNLNDQSIIHRLDEAMANLPNNETDVYYRACRECPDLVNDERKTAFLERVDGDPTLAAARLASYWDFKLELFGERLCFLPVTLEGAMRNEIENMRKWHIVRLLPCKDTAGRAIMYAEPYRRNFSEYSIEQEMMSYWFLIECALEDPEVRRRGIVFIFDTHDLQNEQFSRTEYRYFYRILNVLPGHFRAFHATRITWTVYYILCPIASFVLGKSVRERMIFHYGSEEQMLQSLEAYRLPKDRVPEKLGGKVNPDMAKWLEQRMALEVSRGQLTTGPNGTKTMDEVISSSVDVASISRRDSFDAAISEVADLDVADSLIVPNRRC